MTKKLSIIRVWESVGITQHWGGPWATRRLAEFCKIGYGTKVLDVGCGTGYAACVLAKKYGAEVTALDVSKDLLSEARKRAKRFNVQDRVSFVQANAHHLPFRSGSFDVVISESVLAFCDAKKVGKEIRRVLKSGGLFGSNEATFLKKVSKEYEEVFRHGLGGKFFAHTEREWKSIYKSVGFEVLHSEAHRETPMDDFMSHMVIDGPWAFMKRVGVVFDPKLRWILNPTMIRRIFDLMNYAGYGLYICKK